MGKIQAIQRDIKRDRFFIAACFLFLVLRGVARYSSRDSIIPFDDIDIVLIAVLAIAFFNLGNSRLKLDLIVELDRHLGIVEKQEQKEKNNQPTNAESRLDSDSNLFDSSSIATPPEKSA